MIMICTVIGDLTERPAQHNDYGHFGQKKQFFLPFNRQLRNWGHQSTPPSLGQQNRFIVKLKSTLDCNWSWRHTFLLFTLCWTFVTRTRAGHLPSGNGLGQIFHLSNFDNFGDSNTLLPRRLSSNKRSDTSHTKLSFRGVSSILPANHNNIIHLFQIVYDGTVSLRQYQIPWVGSRVFAHTTRNFDSTQ